MNHNVLKQIAPTFLHWCVNCWSVCHWSLCQMHVITPMRCCSFRRHLSVVALNIFRWLQQLGQVWYSCIWLPGSYLVQLVSMYLQLGFCSPSPLFVGRFFPGSRAPRFRLPVRKFPSKKTFMLPSLTSIVKSAMQGYLLCVTNSYALLECQIIKCPYESSHNISATLRIKWPLFSFYLPFTYLKNSAGSLLIGCHINSRFNDLFSVPLMNYPSVTEPGVVYPPVPLL
jgi:hypothetical protein